MDEKKLLEWITSHQIKFAALMLHTIAMVTAPSPLRCSDFGEVDQEKVDAAIKRFTQSCAGYSVATYVLVRTSLPPSVPRASLPPSVSQGGFYGMKKRNHVTPPPPPPPRALVTGTTTTSW